MLYIVLCLYLLPIVNYILYIVQNQKHVETDIDKNCVMLICCPDMQVFIISWAICSGMSPACRPCNTGVSWRVHPAFWAGKGRNCSEVLPVNTLLALTFLYYCHGYWWYMAWWLVSWLVVKLCTSYCSSCHHHIYDP